MISSAPAPPTEVSGLSEALRRAYGVEPVTVTRLHTGTATDNFVVTDDGGDRWFAKVYRDHDRLDAEREAVELANFARTGGGWTTGVAELSCACATC